ncbi:MAG: hypothetical protein U0670_05720 [Anaerolineae bacterium]
MSTMLVAQAQKAESTPEPSTDADVLSLPLLLSGDSIDASFADTDGAFLAAFNASEGDTVNIYLNATTDSLDPYLALIGTSEAGTALLAANDDFDLSVSFDSAIVGFSIPADGTYFILATSFTYRNTSLTDGAADLTFNLAIDGNTQPADIPEDSFSYYVVNTAVGETITLDINQDAPAYLVAFHGEEGQQVTLDVPSDSLDTLVMLFDNLGQRVGVDDDGGDSFSAQLQATLPTTGVYLAFVTTYDFANIANGDTTVTDGSIDFSVTE